MFAKLYFIALPVLVGIDAIWLAIISKGFYKQHLGFLMTKNPNWLAAIIFYLLFIVGLVIFVISPAVEKGMWLNALLSGALFGMICYATYDLSNLATIKNWPVIVTIVDIIWGSFLSAAVSLITYLIAVK
jgi:uncharacterized membrane protein